MNRFLAPCVPLILFAAFGLFGEKQLSAQVLSVDDIVQPAAGTAEAYYDDGRVIVAIGEGVDLLSVFFSTPNENIVSFDVGGFSESELGVPDEVSNQKVERETGRYSSSFTYFDVSSLAASTSSLPAGVFDIGPVLPSGATSSQAFFDDIAMGWGSGVFYQSVGTSGDFAKLSVVGDLSPIPDSNPFPDPPTNPDPVTPRPGPEPVFIDSAPEVFDDEVVLFYDDGELFLAIGRDVGLVAIFSDVGEDFIGFESPRETDLGDPIIERLSISYVGTSLLPQGLFNLGAVLSEDAAYNGGIQVFWQAPGGFGRSSLLRVVQTVQGIPEPSSLFLTALTVVGLSGRRWRMRSVAGV